MFLSKIIQRIFLILVFICFINSCSQNPVENTEWELVGSGYSFPEGPTWHPDGILYFSNCHGNWITKYQNNKIDTFLISSDQTFSKTNGMFVAADGYIYACDFGKGMILRFSTLGEVDTVISKFQGVALNRPNDLIVLKNGDIYFTDPSNYDRSKFHGRLFYFNRDSDKLHLIADSLAFPNGLGISPFDSKLYVCESMKNLILRFEISDYGIPTNREIFIQLPGGDPDGIDFDIKGNMYVAHFGTGTVFVISPDGKIIQRIKTPGKNPSNVEFGGKDLKTLYITEDETNCVYKIQVNNSGYKYK